MRRTGDSVVAYQRMRVITEAELEQLPEEQRALIKTYEQSMSSFVKEWEKLKRSGADQLSGANRQRKLELIQRKLELIQGAREDLVGILDFLQQQGIYLDDHYLQIRHLVLQLRVP